MPNSTTAKHPSGLEITFTEADHSYIDSAGRRYTSATQVIHSAFPKFDALGIATAKAEKTGIAPEVYLSNWKANAERASCTGTRAHENCEKQMLGRTGEMHKPENEEERLRFRASWHAVEELQATFSRLEPEKIVFSPRFRIAGSIDCLATARDGTFAIIDWKFIKELHTESYGGKTGTAYATQFMPDCNFYHYALQLNLYELILKIEGYIPPLVRVEKRLNVYNATEHVITKWQMPDFPYEALALMAFNATDDRA